MITSTSTVEQIFEFQQQFTQRNPYRFEFLQQLSVDNIKLLYEATLTDEEFFGIVYPLVRWRFDDSKEADMLVRGMLKHDAGEQLPAMTKSPTMRLNQSTKRESKIDFAGNPLNFGRFVTEGSMIGRESSGVTKVEDFGVEEIQA